MPLLLSLFFIMLLQVIFTNNQYDCYCYFIFCFHSNVITIAVWYFAEAPGSGSLQSQFRVLGFRVWGLGLRFCVLWFAVQRVCHRGSSDRRGLVLPVSDLAYVYRTYNRLEVEFSCCWYNVSC